MESYFHVIIQNYVFVVEEIHQELTFGIYNKQR